MDLETRVLYCFKFDDVTGEIIRIVLDDYRVRQVNSFGKKVYVFKSNEICKGVYHYSVTSDKLDRFVSNKVFTFVDDLDRVKKIMNDTLKENIAERKRALDRQIYLLNKLNVKTGVADGAGEHGMDN